MCFFLLSCLRLLRFFACFWVVSFFHFFCYFSISTFLAYQDGGLIANNPAAVAIGECKALWPQHKIQSVVSIGTGRFEPVFGEIKETSIANKLDVIINSATNTHNVHSMMYETLENGVYFRFDPYLSESAAINVWQTDKIESLKLDARRYCYKNDDKFKECVGRLNKMSSLEKKWNGIGKF